MIRFFLTACMIFFPASFALINNSQVLADEPPAYRFTDIVLLRDSARYTGRIIRQSKSKLVLETAFGHIVIIPRDRIYDVIPAGLEGPVAVRLRSGRLIRGILENQSRNSVRLLTEGDQTIEIAWTDIVSLE